MAASDNDPLSAAGLAAALEAGADASGTGGKPVSAGNLKALVDGGKIGVVDVLFRSEAGAASGTLSHPVEDYDVVCLIYSYGSPKSFHMTCANATQWSQFGTALSGRNRTSISPMINGNLNNLYQQAYNGSTRSIRGTQMTTLSGDSSLVHLVIGIKTVGGGLLAYLSPLPEVA